MWAHHLMWLKRPKLAYQLNNMVTYYQMYTLLEKKYFFLKEEKKKLHVYIK